MRDALDLVARDDAFAVDRDAGRYARPAADGDKKRSASMRRGPSTVITSTAPGDELRATGVPDEGAATSIVERSIGGIAERGEVAGEQLLRGIAQPAPTSRRIASHDGTSLPAS